jgi:Sec-independent protein translocase protein TatA
MTVGVLEVLFVLFVVLLILGPRRIVDLGRGVRDFKLEFGNRAGGNRRSSIGEDQEAGDDDRKPVTPKVSDKEL